MAKRTKHKSKPETSEHIIIGMGDAEVSDDGTQSRFILETMKGGPLRIAITSAGLEVFIASLTGLHQKAVRNGLRLPSDTLALETIPSRQVLCGAAADGGVILSFAVPSGTSINLSLDRKTAADLADALKRFANPA